MTPPKIVPCALVSLGISTRRMAGSRPGWLYSNPVFDSLIPHQPNPDRRQKTNRTRRRADAVKDGGPSLLPSLAVSPRLRVSASHLSFTVFRCYCRSYGTEE